MTKWLSNIKDEHVAFTGRAWLNRADLKRKVRKHGGIPISGGEVTKATTILVRGQSPVWAYGDHGEKEKRAAQLIRSGQRIAVVQDVEFKKLLELGRRAKVSDHVAGQPVEWLTTPTKRQFEEVATFNGLLDREHSTKGRIEQSFLRSKLFGKELEADCSLCGRLLPLALLVAAHIKPRSECLRRERLDTANIVFGVCILGCDALYERGLISVRDGGKICPVSKSESLVIKGVLKQYKGKICVAWKDSNAEYFKWHLERRFQG